MNLNFINWAAGNYKKASKSDTGDVGFREITWVLARVGASG